MKTRISVVFIFLIMIIPVEMFAGPVEEGKAIFMTRCAACHNVNKVMTGPALAGVHDRRTEDWIMQFIRSSQTMVKSGDKDAVALYEKFNKVPMPDHPDLTDDHIKNILAYIKSESKTESGEKAPFATPGMKKVNYLPLTIQKDYGFFLVYLVVVGLLISSLLFAVRMNSFKRSLEEKKDPE